MAKTGSAQRSSGEVRDHGCNEYRRMFLSGTLLKRENLQYKRVSTTQPWWRMAMEGQLWRVTMEGNYGGVTMEGRLWRGDYGGQLWRGDYGRATMEGDYGGVTMEGDYGGWLWRETMEGDYGGRLWRGNYGGATMEGRLWRATMEGRLWRGDYGRETMEALDYGRTTIEGLDYGGRLWRGLTMEGQLWRKEIICFSLVIFQQLSAILKKYSDEHFRWKFETAINWIWNLEILSFPMMYDSHSPSKWYHLVNFWSLYHGLWYKNLYINSYIIILRAIRLQWSLVDGLKFMEFDIQIYQTHGRCDSGDQL